MIMLLLMDMIRSLDFRGYAMVIVSLFTSIRIR
jgi:hypothetical protein